MKLYKINNCNTSLRKDKMNIKAFRERYHLSREDLASKIGISWMTIYRWEKCFPKRPNRVIQEKLAQVMAEYKKEA